LLSKLRRKTIEPAYHGMAAHARRRRRQTDEPAASPFRGTDLRSGCLCISRPCGFGWQPNRLPLCYSIPALPQRAGPDLPHGPPTTRSGPSFRGSTSHSPHPLAVSPRNKKAPRGRGSHLVHGVSTTYFDESLGVHAINHFSTLSTAQPAMDLSLAGNRRARSRSSSATLTGPMRVSTSRGAPSI
jgi:hypothetical protein